MDDVLVLKLRSTETMLISRLRGKELWGDINLSEKEYELLNEQLSSFIDSIPRHVEMACQLFPVCITTFMVFLIRLDFNYNFWAPVHQKLSIQISQSTQKVLGECALDTFQRFGFDYSEAEIVRKYIDPILYEAGLPPQSNLDDLFYVLNYDSFNVFDPEAIIDSLLDRRAYRIRKPLLRFLQRFQHDRAIDFLIEAHDAILCTEQNRSGTSRYVENYREWLQNENKNSGRKNRQNKERQARPILFFDFENRGLCIQLPKMVLENEWLESVTWTIRTDTGTLITKELNVQGDDYKRYTEALAVPVSPAERYYVSVRDGDEDGDEDTIAGVSDGGVLFFNANGRQIRPDYYLPHPYCTMIVSDTLKWVANPYLQSTILSFPTDISEYKTIMLEPLSGQAKLKYNTDGKEKTLTAKPQIDMTLRGETLFSLLDKDGIFTQIPELILTADSDAPLSNLVLKFGHCDEEIPLDDYFVDGQARILPDAGMNQYYGSFCYRLYQNGLFLKQIEFSIVPTIRTNYVRPSAQDVGEDVPFEQIWFSKEEGWELIFEGCVVYGDDDTYRIDYPKSSGQLCGTLRCTEEDINFDRRFWLPLRPYEAFVVDQSGEPTQSVATGTAKLSAQEMRETEYWIRIHALSINMDFEFAIVLSSLNGVEQIVPIRPQKNGWMSCDLSCFRDTLRNCPLPASISFVCQELKLEHTLAVIRNVLPLKHRPAYNPKGYIVLSIEDKGADLFLSEFGSTETKILSSQNAKTGKSGKSVGYPCGTLSAGFYCLNAEQNTALLFDANTSSIALEDAQYFIYVRNTNKEDQKLFSAWLDTLLENLSMKMVDCKIPDNVIECSADRIMFEECKKLIYLAAMTSIEKVDAKRKALRHLMYQISVRFLDGYSRMQIIKQLVDLEVSREVFDLCVNQYSLFLFAESKEDNNVALSERVEPYAKELSLLIMMKANAQMQGTLQKERFASLLGKSAVLSMLCVDERITDPHQIKQEQAAFLKERYGCNIQIQITNSISGDMEPIQKMIVIDTKDPYLDLRKKPETGEYFLGMRYVDQYVQWHKRNYDGRMEMKPSVKEQMAQSQKAYAAIILRELSQLKKEHPTIREYEQVLKSRYGKNPLENLTIATPARFFFLLGIATLVFCVSSIEDQEDSQMRDVERFIASANVIAPEMVRRDLLMAQTYLYLIQKEKQLCR